MAFTLNENGGVSYFQSDLLSKVSRVHHGFSTRVGGVSPAPHDSLNLGFYSQDWYDNVVENWGRFLAAIGADLEGVWYQNQLHGNMVREAPEVQGYIVLGEGDAVWTQERRVGVMVTTADCVPVLMTDGDGRAVGAVHAGWKGLLNGVVEATIADLKRGKGVEAEDLRVAAGPHIGSCCFEVQGDVSGPFVDRFGESVMSQTRQGTASINLSAALALAVAEAGIQPEHLDISESCTCCDERLFFSYRRARGRERGLLASVIALEGDSP